MHCIVVSSWVPQKGEFLWVFRQKLELGLVAKQGMGVFWGFLSYEKWVIGWWVNYHPTTKQGLSSSQKNKNYEQKKESWFFGLKELWSDIIITYWLVASRVCLFLINFFPPVRAHNVLLYSKLILFKLKFINFIPPKYY